MDGSEIRARRKALRLSQADFAARAGLSRDFIGQLERGVAEVTPRTAAAIRSVRAVAPAATPRSRDPMELIVEKALIDGGISYQTDLEAETGSMLDFYLPDFDISIEVKRFHSTRIGEQMARVRNVIVAQGETAVHFLAAALRSGDFVHMIRQGK